MKDHPAWLALLLSLVLTGASLFSRPPIPIDETRYLSVAWEMRQTGDYLVPHLNGHVYSHKPPLLFWLINAVWSLTGVEEWSARLVGPLLGMVSILLTTLLARRLWPAIPSRAEMAALIVCSTSLWMVFASMTMFDTLLTAATLTGLLGWHIAASGNRVKGFSLAGVAIGLGLLAKGPICLLHSLPVAFAAPLWWPAATAPRYRTWSLGIAAAILIGAAIALAWVVPAAILGGEVYRQEILWGQTAGRIANSFAHGRPAWWYFPLIPLLLLPWSWSIGGWRDVLARRADPGVRFCGVWVAAVLGALCLVSGKQVHYLIPEIPAVAMLLACGLSCGAASVRRLNLPVIGAATAFCGLLVVLRPLLTFLPEQVTDPSLASPWWGLPPLAIGVWLAAWPPESALVGVRRIAIAAALNIALLQVGAKAGIFDPFDVSPVAREIARMQGEGAEILHFNAYHGEYHFAGRLTRPIPATLTAEERDRWIRLHPDGWVIESFRDPASPILAQAARSFPYRRDIYREWVAIVPARAFTSDGMALRSAEVAARPAQ